ncbi:hypothetical protein GA0070609_3434 [Micromonospora echinaurantiaca]|uniref:Uncharacterized protein n=1 Tax=Micromonospora echinaurantiaca TaxID=47857 RepID=A0A1C5IIR7_9ACTN|nr:hypothetical protein [Micromonospora echinaurantiaca]SCG58282.1 hypothetical protein GA0070609_3434 [Micromonospora echinaurantiaca]
MTDESLAHQIRTLHTETIAAIEQRQTLAVDVRSALITALHNRLICRPGCEDALDTWGLEPLPQRWTISAHAQLSHTRSHTNHDEAREQACFGVPDDLRLLQPAIAVYPRHVIDVTPVIESDQPGPQEYRITAQVTLHTWVTATREAAAYEAARAILEGHLRVLADAGFTVTGLAWQAAHGPDDVPHDDIDTDAGTVDGAAQLPELAGDLTAAIAARDAAVQALNELRRSIRARAIRALIDDEIGGIYQHTAERIDRFLVDLGLHGLPRAHHVTVVADLMLPVGAGTAREACDAARDVMRAATTSGPVETRPWTAYGWTIPEYATCDQDGWRIPWRHEYEMQLRGHATSGDATAAAEALACADLTRALPGIDLVTVTASVETVGIDLYLDPDRD